MKNYALIKYDKSISLLYRLCHRDECFQFAVAYTDGTISYLRSLSKTKEAWGVVFDGYIIAINPRKMMPVQIQDFCKYNVFLGKNYCVPTLNTMEKIIKRINKFNAIFEELNGTAIEANWYMAENDRWLNNHFMLVPQFCLINPQVKISNNRPVFLSIHDEGIFYPAVEL